MQRPQLCRTQGKEEVVEDERVESGRDTSRVGSLQEEAFAELAVKESAAHRFPGRETL